MCTALSMTESRHYFGRNLDLEYDFGQHVIVTPRNYEFTFSQEAEDKGYAMIGMGMPMNEYPLYADAINEKGLGMAGLHFALYGKYPATHEGADLGVGPFEFIPWMLRQCATLDEARALLEKTYLTDKDFAPGVANSKLHWMLSDKTGSLVVEPDEGHLTVTENLLGVLTNDPPFSYHTTNLNCYLNLTPEPAVNRFAKGDDLHSLGKGTGAIGLPGDSSAISRFVRIAFGSANSVCDAGEMGEITQFFHLLDSVASLQGAVRTEDGKYFITRYSSCMFEGRYIYKTYKNSQLTEIDMHRTDLAAKELTVYPLMEEQQIRQGN